VPLYVRGGAIIPMGPEMNYVGEKATDPLTFEIYPDAQGKAQVSLYEDDGVSPAYRKGIERRTAVTYRSSVPDSTDTGAQIDVSPAGSYQPGPRDFVFAVHSVTPSTKTVKLPDNGASQTIRLH